jgi:hypothetical protein
MDDQDNCPDTLNPEQANSDADAIGDACDICPHIPNPGQQETVACIAVTEDGGQCLETGIDLIGESLSGEILVFEVTGVVPSSITFEMLATSCESPVGELSISLNGTVLGVVAIDPGVQCSCEPGIQSFDVSDGSLLASAWLPLGANVFELSMSQASVTGMSWILARLETSAETEDVCLVDFSGGSCDTEDLCLGDLTLPPFVEEVTILDPFANETLISETPYSDSVLPGLIGLDGLPDGPASVCVTATDAGEACLSFSKQGEEDMAINDAACGPPTAAAGVDAQVECESPAGGAVTLDGSGSTDPNSTPGTNDDIVLFEWFEDFGLESETLLGTGEILTVSLPLGTHAVTLRATDSFGGTSTDDVQVVVADTTAPGLVVSPVPDTLWPPNHNLVAVEVLVEATDACGAVAVALVSVSSNEPDNGEGDGDTTDDIQDAELGTPDFDVSLRAFFNDTATTEIYTLAYAATDVGGNVTTESGFVVVPHDQAGTVDPIQLLLSRESAGTLVTWQEAPGALHYDVIRGLVEEITESGAVINLGHVTCIEGNSPDASTAGSEDPMLPEPGEAFFYLVQYDDGVSSSYGTESARKPREPAHGDCE